jgi:intracellular septation protein
LQWVMGDFLPMSSEGWRKFTLRVTLCFAALAVANELIWRTQSDTVWVALETFAFPAVMFAFLSAQFYFLRAHITWDEDKT